MRIIKIFFSIVVLLVATTLIGAAVLPSDYAVKKEVVINANKADVFNYLKHLKNMDNFSVWAKLDPNMKQTYQGTDGTVGFVAAWESDHEHVGKGEQEILAIIDGERIDTELRFIEPFEATNTAYFLTESISDSQTKVTWGFNGRMPYPMNLMLLTMDMEKELGAPLGEGLVNLKNILDK